jgi:signal transduction histidine kinase
MGPHAVGRDPTLAGAEGWCEVGRTLRRGWGYPYFRSGRGRRSIGSIAVLGFVIAGVTMAALAVATALFGTAELGVVSGLPGAQVLHVDPGSFAWREGIRVGQTVVTLRSSDTPAGGGIVTQADGVRMGATVGGATAHLRDSLPPALIALAFAALAVVAFPWRPRRAAALATFGIVVASVPLTVASPPAIEIPARLLALAAPATWSARWGLRSVRARSVIVALTLLLAAAWLAAWLAAPAFFDSIDDLRVAAVLAGCAGVLALQVEVDAARSWFRSVGGLRALDVLALALALALVAVLQLIVEAPPLLTVVVLVAGGLVYPRLRREVGGALDRLFVADLRDRLTVEATEAERGRLARDLHDVPLQEIAGVIRRLDAVPDAQAEVSALRTVADHLRDVATDLRSPVLDDLGLAPAIEFLVAQLGAPAPDFRAETDLRTEAGPTRDARPPAEVEVAVFRIVQEALSNAMRHSGGTRAVVRGAVSRDRIALSVIDDGHGLRPAAVERAVREGHMGTASMRQRARSIGASLRIENGKDGGLAVRVEWPV